ncbi:prohead protease/major capsid protein fusion protein [Sphingomonas sp. IW22]|uniref:prohead protease/major capsid protein fusion protein n=1 Tax=Sphingomonas sp. IW22 TaxID=3242489 RepID=UPI00351FCECB
MAIATRSEAARLIDRLLPRVPEAQLAERKIPLPATTRAAQLQPTSWNAEDRTIDVVWTTGARGHQFIWEEGGLVDEELATGSTNVRLDRLNAGAPVLNAHKRGALGDQIGIVVPGSARMVRGQGIATLKLSERSDLAPIVADIAAGIIRNLSIGYTVHAYDVTRSANQRPLYRAVDWEPNEVSFVPVPLDAGAQVRSAPSSLSPCRIRNLSPSEAKFMSNGLFSRFSRRSVTPAHAPAIAEDDDDQDVRLDDSQPAPIAWLREFVGYATEIEPHLRSELALELAERGVTQKQASSAVLKILGEKQRNDAAGIANGGVTFHHGLGPVARLIIGGGNRTMDNPDFHARSIEDAIFARMSGTAPTEQARQFMGLSMVQLAGEMLERAGARGVNRMGPNEVLEAAAWNSNRGHSGVLADVYSRGGGGGMLTTSDFPELLLGAGDRFLLHVFEAAASPLKQVSRQRTARDFREISGIELSGFGKLEEVLESGEIKHGSFRTRKEGYKLRTFAKQFALSRQAIINDDLGAFGDPIRIMARAAAETEASLFAELLNGNPVMADGQPLFAAAHGNLAPAGALPSVSTLGSARLAMRSQTDLDGITPLNVVPEYIVASPKLETLIDQLLANVAATSIGEVNAFAGKLKPLIDVRLTGNAWYVFAGTGSAPVFEHAYLDSNPGPKMDQEQGWDVLGQKYRIYMDFGAGVIDHRGGFKNPGAAN